MAVIYIDTFPVGRIKSTLSHIQGYLGVSRANFAVINVCGADSCLSLRVRVYCSLGVVSFGSLSNL